MLSLFKYIYTYRELMFTLAWKDIAVRYKQAYLGILWSILKPVGLMLIFTMIRSFIGIDSGDVPYPVLTFVALMPWVLFQESLSAGLNSIVSNITLIRKIYFPREILPIAAVVTRLFELLINSLIATALIYYYSIEISQHILWAPCIITYTIVVSLSISFLFSALNVYYRDIGQALPILLSLLMYASPIMYPLDLVKKTLITNQAAGEWSALIYKVYLLNPIVGIVDSFQKSLLKQASPDLEIVIPGLITTVILLPFSYWYFKKAERFFADII